MYLCPHISQFDCRFSIEAAVMASRNDMSTALPWAFQYLLMST